MAIIKCPECGHPVSDKAPTCPTCGVEIAGKITTCTNSGTVYFSTLNMSPNCHSPNPRLRKEQQHLQFLQFNQTQSFLLFRNHQLPTRTNRRRSPTAPS